MTRVNPLERSHPRLVWRASGGGYDVLPCCWRRSRLPSIGAARLPAIFPVCTDAAGGVGSRRGEESRSLLQDRLAAGRDAGDQPLCVAGDRQRGLHTVADVAVDWRRRRAEAHRRSRKAPRVLRGPEALSCVRHSARNTRRHSPPRCAPSHKGAPGKASTCPRICVRQPMHAPFETGTRCPRRRRYRCPRHR